MHPPAFQQIEGTWTGTLQKVEGYGVRHDSYWLTLLVIDSGPHWPSGTVPSGVSQRLPQHLQSDRSAVLAYDPNPGGPFYCVDPAQAPIGHRVRVRGMMTVGPVNAKDAQGAAITVARKIPNYQGPVPSHELVIVFDGEPEVID